MAEFSVSVHGYWTKDQYYECVDNDVQLKTIEEDEDNNDGDVNVDDDDEKKQMNENDFLDDSSDEDSDLQNID